MSFRDLEWLAADHTQRTSSRGRNHVAGITLNLGDDTQPVQFHQTEGHVGEVRDGVVRLQEHGFSSMPLPGGKGVALYLGGNRAQGIVFATEDTRYRPTGLKPGEFLLYAVAGAAADGTGGTTRPILKGTVDGKGQLTGIEVDIGDSNTTTIVIGSNGNTATVNVYGKTSVTVHSPQIVATNGGTPHPVMTTGGNSTVLQADA